jgi:hypothetical protein
MPGQTKKRFANYYSRSAVLARNNLGIIQAEDAIGSKKVRKKELEVYDEYYENAQYDNLPQWDDSHAKDGEYIAVRKRQPRIIFNFAKVLIDRVTAKLVGKSVFPALKVEDDPDTTTFIGLVIKASKLKSRIQDAVKLMCRSGSSFMRFFVVDGALMVETYHSKHCYPIFHPNGTLSSIRIQYVYTDEEDKDGAGKAKQKWFRMDLAENEDVLFDNPEYKPDSIPKFTPVSTATHNLGFVQGEWFRTTEDKHSPDGISLIGDVLDFIDELNYSFSQTSQAIGYGQEPQMTFSGVDAEELENIIKSSSKAWALGKDGRAAFVEPTMAGVTAATEFRDKCKHAMQDVARIVLLDPEKMVGRGAQSGKAMEIMHAPLIELIDELRPEVEDKLSDFVIKMCATIVQLNNSGMQTVVLTPPGWTPESLNITVHWPLVFPPTVEDLNMKVMAASKAVLSRMISQESATRYVAQDFGIENVDEELEKISEDPPLNPFGAGAGGEDGNPMGGLGQENEGEENYGK